jgi:hypothetical protein
MLKISQVILTGTIVVLAGGLKIVTAQLLNPNPNQIQQCELTLYEKASTSSIVISNSIPSTRYKINQNFSGSYSNVYSIQIPNFSDFGNLHDNLNDSVTSYKLNCNTYVNQTQPNDVQNKIYVSSETFFTEANFSGKSYSHSGESLLYPNNIFGSTANTFTKESRKLPITGISSMTIVFYPK